MLLILHNNTYSSSIVAYFAKFNARVNFQLFFIYRVHRGTGTNEQQATIDGSVTVRKHRILAETSEIFSKNIDRFNLFSVFLQFTLISIYQ